MQIPNMHLYANILDIYAKNMLKYAKLNMHKYAFLNMHNMLNICFVMHYMPKYA